MAAEVHELIVEPEAARIPADALATLQDRDARPLEVAQPAGGAGAGGTGTENDDVQRLCRAHGAMLM
jgi:hypothetical protein